MMSGYSRRKRGQYRDTKSSLASEGEVTSHNEIVKEWITQVYSDFYVKLESQLLLR